MPRAAPRRGAAGRRPGRAADLREGVGQAAAAIDAGRRGSWSGSGRPCLERPRHQRPPRDRRPSPQGRGEGARRAPPGVVPLQGGLRRPVRFPLPWLAGRVNVIAEHKRRSPSRGGFREELAPGGRGQELPAGGAAALSVLTNDPSFGGRLEHLVAARAATDLPRAPQGLRRRPLAGRLGAAGADAVLLIVAALEDETLASLLELTVWRGSTPWSRCTTAGSWIGPWEPHRDRVGVDDRNLKTLQVSLGTALSLAGAIPDGVVTVAESGIRTERTSGGSATRASTPSSWEQHLMGAPDPGQALQPSRGGEMSRVFVKVCGVANSGGRPGCSRGRGRRPGLRLLHHASPRFVERERAAAISRDPPPHGPDEVGLLRGRHPRRDGADRRRGGAGSSPASRPRHRRSAFEELPGARPESAAGRERFRSGGRPALRAAACGILVDTRLATRRHP